MAREPSFPDEAFGATPREQSAEEGAAAPAPAAEGADAETPAETNRRTRQIVAGAAIGIGSAAIVAALLYATRTKRQERKPVDPIESD